FFISFFYCSLTPLYSHSFPTRRSSDLDATNQLLILLPGVYLVGLESVLVQHFTGTGLPFAIPLFWLITMVLNVALNLTFVPVWGARAAALNSTLSYALIFVLVAVHFCRQTV